jgi:DNA-binding MarR family transcriptional regulator
MSRNACFARANTAKWPEMADLKLDLFLPYRLSVVSNRVSAAIATAYDRLFGLKIPEWRLIAVIAEGPGITQQALGVATRMDKVTVSRAAQALVERGLVARAPNEGDRRSHLLALTATGRFLQTLQRAARAPLSAMLDRIEAAASEVAPEGVGAD